MPKQNGTTSRITAEELRKYYHLPISDAANMLGICITQLKRICRKLGIKKWPHRQIRSLKRSIQKLNNAANDSSGIERQRFLAESKVLELKMQYIISSVGNTVASSEDDAQRLEPSTSEYIEKAQQCFGLSNGGSYERADTASQLTVDSMSLHEYTSNSTCSSSRGSDQSRRCGSDNSSECNSPSFSDDEQLYTTHSAQNARFHNGYLMDHAKCNLRQSFANEQNRNMTIIPFSRNNQMQLDQDYELGHQERFYRNQSESFSEPTLATTLLPPRHDSVSADVIPPWYSRREELSSVSIYSAYQSQQLDHPEATTLPQQTNTSGSSSKNNIISILN